MNHEISYAGNSVYQFSYAWPIYKELGGTFRLRKKKQILEYKWFMRNMNQFPDKIKTYLNTPPVKQINTKNCYDFRGILISFMNSEIKRDTSKCIAIFSGHGTGDKVYGGNPNNLSSYDYIFVTGEKHIEKMKDSGINMPEEKLIKTGNIRFDDYLNNKMNRDSALASLGIKDRNRKNILYAPTWKWGDGTYRKYVYRFCEELTKEYNLIVRPHSNDAKHIPIVKLWARLKGIKHVYFSNPKNLRERDTMFDFLISDLMISDTSSVIYEYLVTQKPIIIAQNDCKILHSMPDKYNINSFVDIYNGTQNINEMVRENLYSEKNKNKYRQMLFDCFYFNDGASSKRAIEFLKSLKI